MRKNVVMQAASRSNSTTSFCIDWPDTTQSLLDDEFLNEDEMMISNSDGEPEGFGNSELPLHSSLYTPLESKEAGRLDGSPLVSFPESGFKRTQNVTKPLLTKPSISNSRKRRKKPSGMPKRPLSAYNIFFRTQRTIVQAKAKKEKLVGSKGLGFEGLGKFIGKQWKEVSKEERKKYEILAEKDNFRYRQEMDAYNEKKKMLMEKERSCHVLPSVIGLEVASRHCPNFVLSESSRRNAAAFSSQTRMDERVDTSQARLSTINGLVQEDFNLRNSQHSAYAPLPMVQPLNDSTGKLPLPQGMEIVLRDTTGQDRKYRVDYKCYTMSRAEAFRYIDSVSSEFQPYYGRATVISPENREIPEDCAEFPNERTAPL